MQRIWIAAAAALFANMAYAQTAAQPVLQPQDTWTFRRTTETQPNVWRQVHFEGTVLRNSASTTLIQNKEVDSPNPPREILIGSDWSNFRSLSGKETIVHRPFTFPMSVGKTWDLEFTDDHPNNKSHKSETRKLKYRVVGWEDVEVPAGKFKALKIEADGSWSGEICSPHDRKHGDSSRCTRHHGGCADRQRRGGNGYGPALPGVLVCTPSQARSKKRRGELRHQRRPQRSLHQRIGVVQSLQDRVGTARRGKHSWNARPQPCPCLCGMLPAFKNKNVAERRDSNADRRGCSLETGDV